ncbi:hypothetical protein ACFV1B_25295 [Streptomyces sp. NPDC059637]|uniref:hypothetical protein n=1 Tax=Streptomyces sp. NPDC059637 TaxID=3347752 RepID=UPI0036913284
MLEKSGTIDTTQLLPLWYTLPEGFDPIDLSGVPEERMEANYQGISDLYPSATKEQLTASVLSFEVALGRMVEEGLVHISSFALGTEDGILLTGLCQIFVVERPPGDPNLYPRAALEAHPDEGPGVHKGIVPLPAGLAAVVVSDRTVQVPGVFFGVPTDSTSAVRTASFQIAFPRIPQAVVVTLSTEVIEAEEEFLELATLVAAGVSFTAPRPVRALPEQADAGVEPSPFG